MPDNPLIPLGSKSTKKLVAIGDIPGNSSRCTKRKTYLKRSFEFWSPDAIRNTRKPAFHIFPPATTTDDGLKNVKGVGLSILKVPRDPAFDKYWRLKKTEFPESKARIRKGTKNNVGLSTSDSNFKSALENLLCPKYKPQKWSTSNEVPNVQTRLPIHSMSNVYQDLKKRRFARGPDPTKFRREKFSIWEEQRKEIEKALLVQNSRDLGAGVCDDKLQFIFKKADKKTSNLSGPMKRYQVKLWKDFLKHRQSDEAKDWRYWTELDPNNILEPNNKVDYGCERVRQLASLQPNVTFTIVKRFVTGPCGKNLFWLNRTQAVDCWRRIVGKGPRPEIQPCCVDEPQQPKIKLHIPSLRTPSLKKKKKKQRASKPEEDYQLGSARKPKTSSKKKKTKKQRIEKVSRPPPFCDPYPNPEERMPWHIPALKPLDGNDQRVKFFVERTVDLDDMIGRRWDPYGEDRNKQKYERSVEAREKMVNRFFTLTEPEQVLNQLEVVEMLARTSLSNDPNINAKKIQSRKDMVLAQLLRRNDNTNNTAASMRIEEQNKEKIKRQNARDHFQDFSAVTSRYLDVNSRGKQIKRNKTWKSKWALKYV